MVNVTICGIHTDPMGYNPLCKLVTIPVLGDGQRPIHGCLRPWPIHGSLGAEVLWATAPIPRAFKDQVTIVENV